MLLFIYCEWLDSELVKAHLPNAEFKAKATLDDSEVAFSFFREDASDELMQGGCHIEKKRGNILYGVLYEISAEDLSSLDKMTRVKEGRYEKRYLNVSGQDGKKYEAVAHVIKTPKGKCYPTTEYLEHMIKGAKEHNFPKAYVASLEKYRA